MLHNIIRDKKNKWVQSDNCTITDLLKYICVTGQLRDTQIEAIETYLISRKLRAKKQTALAIIFMKVFFTNGTDLHETKYKPGCARFFKGQ